MNNPIEKNHLILGTGPAACWTAKALVERGAIVTAVNRSGRKPSLMPANVEIIKADLLDSDQLSIITSRATDATVVYQLLHPPYSQWDEFFPRLQLAAIRIAQTMCAKLVALENLYMMDYRQIMTESSAVAPCSMKGHLRQKMHEDLMTLHRRGGLEVAIIRSSDFYGPGVINSAFGERLFKPLLAGKSGSLMGDMHQLHSVAYIKDVGRALAQLGLSENAELSGRYWLAPHNPAMRQIEWFADAISQWKSTVNSSAAKVTPNGVQPWMLHMVGLFNRDAKASIEMMYQFQNPFVVDSSISEQALELKPTNLSLSMSETLDWYRQRLNQKIANKSSFNEKKSN
jgi:nucleoside-diphosphate-sugar epimerase